MATLIDTPPDKIERTDYGQHLFYFAGGEDFATLPAGTQYIIVYEPTAFISKWRAVIYELMPVEGSGTWAKELTQRELTPEEIAHFEKLIADMGGADEQA